jgi:hypothetical protein
MLVWSFMSALILEAPPPFQSRIDRARRTLQDLAMVRAIGVVLLVLGAAAPAGAQDVCREAGAIYRQGAQLCIRGLVQLCMNGTWQNLDGQRCRDDGLYLNPGQYQFDPNAVIEVPEPLPPPDWRPPVGGPYPLDADGRVLIPRD